MNEKELESLLKALKREDLTLEEVMDRLKELNTVDLHFAQIDHHRSIRKGFPEVVFCQGKELIDARDIILELAKNNKNLLATRASKELFLELKPLLGGVEYHPRSRLITLEGEKIEKQGQVLVICAGTSDLPVAEEAAITASLMGSQVNTVVDVGVAGIHRLFQYQDDLRKAQVIVVVAGMEGALPSVVSGLVKVPVLAVPTSIGYGAHFGGLSSLLTMLNSCAPGIATLNIDNGFGAGYMAHLINGGKGR